ncbi:Ger(x)C family spore germination protein [Fictibacillus barbaricus]|uniref:Ger(X)C family germination protein n=1 Tax=Fictibacillus barbaricus TaxID=182136 RepID=A0ABU1TXM4_9BACL|nr:Ger(x)C family spore germination protein [Fictibacillus barbaricus]MDR7071943.1 Ger(x)C family germination protein [Fictibacillus barbaricus]
MKKRWCCLPALFLLTGCWDTQALHKTKLITAGGFDYTKNGNVTITASIPQSIAPAAGGQTLINQAYSATGHTARQSRVLLDRKVSEQLDVSKNQIIIFGEDSAKKDIYQLLDVFYRDPKSALNAKIAVTKGSAKDVISNKYMETESGSTGIGEYLRDVIKSSEESATVTKETIQSVCPIMFDPGQDFTLPYIIPLKHTAKVDGVAVFHGEKMVGTITGPTSVLYVMLTGQHYTKAMSTTRKISSDKKVKLNNFTSFKVKKNKRILDVTVSATGQISVDLQLKTRVIIIEYPHNNLNTSGEVEKVEKELSATLTKESQKIVAKLQKMNADTFGIGRELMAFHYPFWKKLDWEKEYPKIPIHTKVDITVIGHGIIE